MRVAADAANAACVRKTVHLEMREAVAARRKSARVSRVLARARLVKAVYPHSKDLPLRFLRRQGGTWNCEGVQGRLVLSLCGHRGVLLRQSGRADVGVYRRQCVGRLENCRLPIRHPALNFPFV